MEPKIERRKFLGTAAASGAFTIVPKHVLGGQGADGNIPCNSLISSPPARPGRRQKLSGPSSGPSAALELLLYQ